ncbi:MAG: choice-of-anchor D domain-containing protein [Agitococcus sp.]|nr:choice-of-anchor D domain-containing protein [Agitococcus sp.]
MFASQRKRLVAAVSLSLLVLQPMGATAATGDFSYYKAIPGLIVTGGPVLQGSASLSNTSLTFAAQEVGTTSTAQNVTVTNNGTAPLTIFGVSVDQGITHFNQSNDCAVPIAVGMSCAISVAMTPRDSGALFGRVLVGNDGSSGAGAIILTGSGTQDNTPPAASGTVAANTSFGTHIVADIVQQDIVVTNTGVVPLSISAPASAVNSDTGEFTFVSSTCPASLAAAAACLVKVQFHGTSLGTRTGTLHLTTGAGTLTSSLTAVISQGIASIGDIGMDATPVSTGSSKTVQLFNTGNAPLVVSGISLVSGNPPYTLVSNTCGSPIAASQSCSITLGFAPTVAGVQPQGNLLIANNGMSGAVSLAINGTGQALASVTFKDASNVALSSITFPNTSVGLSSSAITVSLTNPGDLPVIFTEPPLTAAAPFSISSTDCTSTLAPSAKCSVSLIFSPIAIQEYSGPSYNLSVNSNGVATPLLLTGTGSGVGVSQVVTSGNANVTFVQKTNGSWVAVGANNAGQLGLGDNTNRNSFTAVPALMGATKVVVAGDTTWARLENGNWMAAGANESGQLGLGNTTNSTSFVAVASLTGAHSVVPGYQHTFARKSNGAWFATGSNAYGQLGLGDNTNRNSFTAVPALGDAPNVRPGIYHTLAQRTDGNWVATGNNAYGQLGLGDNAHRNSFTAVTALNGLSNVVSSGHATFARQLNGNWVAAGYNGDGELGIGTVTSQNTFVAVPLLNGAARVITGGNNTWAQLGNGNWVATGYNAQGQLGIGNTTTKLSFVAVPSLNGATTVAVGFYHVVASTSTGSWVTVGGNSMGQLGLGDVTNRSNFTSLTP